MLGPWRLFPKVWSTFAWLHAFKRLAIRYERRGDIHQGLLGLACCIICTRRLHTDF
jgi:hypothetical protein